jgi:kumamolisin
VEYGAYTGLQSDLNTFSAQFGLPNVTVTQICTPAPPCSSNAGTGWDVETALDVEYAHAMAPNAQIIVAEFKTDPFMNGAETQAAAAVAAAGGGEVSNSWTECFGNGCNPEGPSELQLDQYLTTPGVVYFASAGDYGWGPAYPSVSPNVVSAGGTAIIRDANGNFTGENCWWGSGGGRSQYEQSPRYQWIISNLTGPFRGTPDLAADADPQSGVDVYNSTYCSGWCVVGGTSVASPVLAGIVNASGSFHTSTNTELTQTYTEYGTGIGSYSKYFRDVQIGSNGYSSQIGWDQCTGIGSIRNPQGL